MSIVEQTELTGEIGAGELAAALKVVKPIMKRNRSNPMPILRRVMIDSSPHGLVRLRATNVDVWAEVPLNTAVMSPGVCTVEFSVLEAAVKAAGKKGTVMFLGGGVHAGAVTGVGSVFEASEFPKWPEFQEDFDRSQSGWDVSALRGVAVAMSSDEARPTICGVVFEEAVLVATDSYRLHWAGQMRSEKGEQVIVQADAVKAVLAYGADTVRVFTDPADRRYIVVRSSGLRLVCRQVEATFPSFRNLVPHGTDTAIVSGLDGAVRALPVKPKDPTAVRLDFERGEAVMAFPDGPTARARFDAVFDRVPPVIGFSPGFLGDALGVAGGSSVLVSFVDSLKPVVFTGDSAVSALVMPTRI